MTDAERILIAQGLVGLALQDRGATRDDVLHGMAEVAGGAFSDERWKFLFSTWTPSLALAWAECGFPRVEPAHKLAASLMATTMPDEQIADLRMPWRAFAVSVPAGVIDAAEQFILVVESKAGPFWNFATMPSGHVDVGFEKTLADFADVKFKNKEKHDGDAALALSWSAHERFLGLLGRLTVGVIAEMQNHRPSLTRWSAKRVADAVAAGPSGDPRSTAFKLLRPVTLDVRGEVREYASNGGSKPTVRTLVRGHWKFQSHGLGGADRKLIHVEPYWRGPDGAPIGVRPHVIRGKS